jgi:adenosylcobinamide kinase/adenosylcobinamide-phosphate guanylyltransferase
MALTLVLGGARSGKSRWAQAQAEARGGALTMIVTGEPLDAEMAERIARHRADRDPRWRTVEAPLDLAAALAALGPGGAAVVDCLTLWLSNLMLREVDLEATFHDLEAAARSAPGDVWLVSNEVGQGVVPENALGRRFRDAAGRLHQRLAALADRVVMIAAGLPLWLKGAPGGPDARLREIEDRQAIQDVIMRYCRGVDRADPSLILSAFHDDATDNHFGVVLPFRQAISSLRPPAESTPANMTHQICNVLIELDDDVARCESYLVAITRLEHAGRQFDWTLTGRYVDRFERRGGDWRIAHRTVVYDRERFDEVIPPPQSLPATRYLDRAVRGMRGPADWSWQVFRERG